MMDVIKMFFKNQAKVTLTSLFGTKAEILKFDLDTEEERSFFRETMPIFLDKGIDEIMRGLVEETINERFLKELTDEELVSFYEYITSSAFTKIKAATVGFYASIIEDSSKFFEEIIAPIISDVSVILKNIDKPSVTFKDYRMKDPETGVEYDEYDILINDKNTFIDWHSANSLHDDDENLN